MTRTKNILDAVEENVNDIVDFAVGKRRKR